MHKIIAYSFIVLVSVVFCGQAQAALFKGHQLTEYGKIVRDKIYNDHIREHGPTPGCRAPSVALQLEGKRLNFAHFERLSHVIKRQSGDPFSRTRKETYTIDLEGMEGKPESMLSVRKDTGSGQHEAEFTIHEFGCYRSYVILNASEVFEAVLNLYQQEQHQRTVIFFSEIIPSSPIMQQVTQSSISYLLCYYRRKQAHSIKFERIPLPENFPRIIGVTKDFVTGDCTWLHMQPAEGEFRPLASEDAHAFYCALEAWFYREYPDSKRPDELIGPFKTPQSDWLTEPFEIPRTSVYCEIIEYDSDEDTMALHGQAYSSSSHNRSNR